MKEHNAPLTEAQFAVAERIREYQDLGSRRGRSGVEKTLGLSPVAYKTFSREHRTKLRSTNPIERLHAEIKRRTNVVGIFRNEDAITRLVGALPLEQNDEWAVARRYMTLESIAPASDTLTAKPPVVAA